MPEKKKDKEQAKPKADESSSGGSGLDNVIEKIDDVVGKIVPEKFLRTAVAGGVVLTVFFFILTLWGFMRSPGGVADEATKSLDVEKDAHGETRKELSAARDAAKQAERKVATLESQVKKLESQRKSVDDAIAKLKGQVDQERMAHGETRKVLQETNAEKRDAGSKAKALQSLLDRQKRETDAAKKQKKTVEDRLAKINKQYVELQKQKDLRSKMEGRAREAYENIIETVKTIEDPAKRLETLKKLAAASATDLSGTPYQVRLDDEVTRTQRVLDSQKARNLKLARVNAKKTTDEALRSARMAPTHEGAMKILGEAKEVVAGTAYEETIHRDMERRRVDNKLAVARKAYEDVVKAIKTGPLKFDENIALAEDNIERTKETKYETLLKKQLKSLKAQRLESIGRTLYDQARAQVSKSPKEYAANVAALKDYLARAKGTRYERSIAKLLARQEALLARSQK